MFKGDFSATHSLQVTNVKPKVAVPFSSELRSVFYFRVEVMHLNNGHCHEDCIGTALPKSIGMKEQEATGPFLTKQ